MVLIVVFNVKQADISLEEAAFSFLFESLRTRTPAAAIIITSDGDFVSLVRTLRTYGVITIVIGRDDIAASAQFVRWPTAMLLGRQ